MLTKITSIITGVLLLSACGSEEMPIPKPPTFLNIELPAHSYKKHSESCPYEFDVSTLYQVRNVYDGKKLTCHKDILLGKLNGTLHFSYIIMDKPLKVYINYAIDKVDEHKIKATDIRDNQIIRPKDKVYGTFFELKGDVASPFQFYLTDSVSRFISGVVYMNSRPNYDSIKPSLDYIKKDLNKMLGSFKWK
jgi:gliding motility-associated lipoprotein GldD